MTIKVSFLVGLVSFTCLNVIQSGVLIKYKTKLQLKGNLFNANNACRSILFIRAIYTFLDAVQCYIRADEESFTHLFIRSFTRVCGFNELDETNCLVS